MFERMIKMFGPPPIPYNHIPYPSQSFFPTSGPPMPPVSIPHGAAQNTGFLSKLFGGSSAVSNATSTLTSGQGMNLGQMIGMVQHAQKAIQTVQTVGPIIQQYGPMVKALPQLMQLLSAQSKNSDSSNTSTKTKSSSTEKKSVSKKMPSKKSDDISKKKKNKSRHPSKKTTKPMNKNKQKSNNIPEPKLYI